MSGNFSKPGDEIAGHRVLRLIGTGFEGETYLVRHGSSNLLRTLKLFRGRDRAQEVRMTARRFQRLSGISSVKQFRDVGGFGGQPSVGTRHWIAFDDVVGISLDHLICKGAIRSPHRMALALLEALHPVHERRMAIGDFDRGRNVIRSTNGRYVFCDLDAGDPKNSPPGRRADISEVANLYLAASRANGRLATQSERHSIRGAKSLSELAAALGRAWR